MSSAGVLLETEEAAGLDRFVTVRQGGQLLALPIGAVKDVFFVTRLTPAPLAPPVVVGLTNLRGKVVLVLCLARLLGLAVAPAKGPRMAVSAEWRGETIGLLVDQVGDVLIAPTGEAGAPPATLSGPLATYARRIHPLERELMIEIDLAALLEAPLLQAA